MDGVRRRTRGQGFTNKVSMTASIMRSKVEVLGLLVAVNCRRGGAWLQGLRWTRGHDLCRCVIVTVVEEW